MIIKVCGLNDSDTIRSIDALGADLIGFIFHPASLRNVTTSHLPETTTAKVGVFVDYPIDDLLELTRQHLFKWVQLHGMESPQYVQRLSAQGINVIKTFSISDLLDLSNMEAYAEDSAYFLFDTKGINTGGNGIKFDWTLLEDYNLPTPFILSGGIGPSDIQKIRNIQHPHFAGIDINSQFEIRPGIKNISLVKSFIDEFKN
ncbi:MAG: phosphoribosylanthranilate isomerase [Bacteroidota bacterium]|nr:phosphoribosylanthranilate isomerase [Bacteroidota bacterium]